MIMMWTRSTSKHLFSSLLTLLVCAWSTLRIRKVLTLYEECKKLIYKLRLSFFLFGLINNVLYVIILSAALDLVPPNTPKGIIAFCNIFPALVVKVGWPYILKGTIRYRRRLIGCCMLSICGMIVRTPGSASYKVYLI